MRILAAILPVILFACSRNPNEGAQTSLQVDSLSDTFRVCEESIITTAAGQQIGVQSLEAGNGHYTFVIGGDTVSGFAANDPKVEFRFQRFLDDSLVLFRLPVKVYTETEFAALMSLPEEELEKFCWLVAASGPAEMEITLGAVTLAQLDDDPELERILGTSWGFEQRYNVFDNRAGIWKNIGSFGLSNSDAFREIDLSLPGHFGGDIWVHACGFGVTARQYFRILNDTVVSSLRVENSIVHNYFSSLIPEVEVYVEANSTNHISGNTITCNYKISLEAISHADTALAYRQMETPLTIHYDKKGDLYVLRESEFRPDTATTNYFNIDIYVQKRLLYLQKNGTPNQKELLHNFKYDGNYVYGM